MGSNSYSSSKPPTVIREVWPHNLEFEFELIHTIVDRYPLISMDMEFPDVIFRPPLEDHRRWHLSDLYEELQAGNGGEERASSRGVESWSREASREESSSDEASSTSLLWFALQSREAADMSMA
ncbi:hypothetical protein CDL15_Pgr006007 [Punica granatum]|uniref:Uncharacterized protein n=1 Tax=Punica granatum TaxID=22663 RepID=A0A218VTC3_PUNGR|nr:hypothetical protein CDL15_Pgr006007 [Punica granatum]